MEKMDFFADVNLLEQTIWIKVVLDCKSSPVNRDQWLVIRVHFACAWPFDPIYVPFIITIAHVHYILTSKIPYIKFPWLIDLFSSNSFVLLNIKWNKLTAKIQNRLISTLKISFLALSQNYVINLTKRKWILNRNKESRLFNWHLPKIRTVARKTF